MPAQLFVAPPTSLFTIARGWQWSYDRRDTAISSLVENNAAQVTYDAVASNYRATMPLVGTGTIFQTNAARSAALLEPTYNGTLAPDSASTVNRNELYFLRTDPPFRYVTAISWFDDQVLNETVTQYVYGVVGVAQPAPIEKIPEAGARSYSGSVVAYIGGNGLDYVGGPIELQFDFASGTFSLTSNVELICLWGCSGYPSSRLTAANVGYARSAGLFSGELTTNGTAARGQFEGRFAGPDAEELLIGFHAPYFDPERQRWSTIAGIVIARQN